MDNETFKLLSILGVNAGLLEQQRQQLHFIDLSHLEPEQAEALKGVINMLESWSPPIR